MEKQEEKKELEKITRKITRLCQETKQKILCLNGEISMELINFAKEYNEIWNQAN